MIEPDSIVLTLDGSELTLESGRNSDTTWGQNEDAVSLAEKRLEQFWTAIEQYFGKERDGAECFWEDWSLAIAKQIADGLMVVKAEIPDKLKPHLAREGLVIVLGGRTFLKSILVRSLASSWLHLLKQKTSSPSVGNSTSI